MRRRGDGPGPDGRTGGVRETTSKQEGFYQFLGLAPGVYTLEAELASFRSYRAAGMQLRVDESIRADLRMELGAVTEQVQVTAAATVVQMPSFTLSIAQESPPFAGGHLRAGGRRG